MTSELEVFMRENVYQRLAKHLSSLGMGYPEKKELLEILRENFTPLEAEVALAIPWKFIPADLFRRTSDSIHSRSP